MMRRIGILAALLGLQLALAASLGFLGRSSGAFRSDEKVIDLDPATLDEISIEEQGQPALVMRQKGGTWVLPQRFDFPAASDKLDHLTEKLFGLTKSWPVGTTAVAAERFKVTDEDFERRITFSPRDGDRTVLLIGTSPGFKKVHARLADRPAIYAIDFSAYEASVKPQDWEDKDFLKLERDQIARVEMPGISLIRDGDALTINGLDEDEEVDSAEVSSLVSSLSKPAFLEVLGPEGKAEYRQDAPLLTYSIETKSGEVLDYTYSQPKDGDDLVLKVSSHPEYFKTSRHSIESLQGLTRDGLVVEKKAAESAERGEGAEEEEQRAASGGGLSAPSSPATSPPSESP